MALPEPGKYIAKLCDTPVVHDRKNDDPPGIGVQIFLPCEVVESGARITAIRTLISKEKVIQLNEWTRLQEIFGAYAVPFNEGAQPACGPGMFDSDQSNSYFEKTFEIDVQDEEYNGKTSRKVKWINVVGGGGMKMPKPVETRSFLAEYGSKFRALAGPAKPAAPPSVAPKTPPPAPVPQTGPTATMQEAWTALLETNKDIAQEDATQLWQTTISSMFPGKTNTDLTPQDWGQVKEKLSDYVPF